MAAAVTATATALPSVRDVPLSSKQETLLLSLERRVQLHAQAEQHAALHKTATTPGASDSSSIDGSRAATVKEFLRQHVHDVAALGVSVSASGELTVVANTRSQEELDVRGASRFSAELEHCMADWQALHAHAHESMALVEEMETSHGQVVSKTQALYDSFENILQQVDALTTRVDLIAAPMPHFIAIDGIAKTLGFGVKFALPSSSGAGKDGAAASAVQQPVQVFQHKRNVDPTTPAFQQALEKIDVAVAFLEDHREFKDAVCYIEAYRTLTAGAIECLKEYTISGLDAAKETVLEAVNKAKTDAETDGRAASTMHAASAGEIDETSPYYVHFQLVAPSLTAVALQLERLATSNAAAASTSAYMANVMALADVCNAYAAQRVQLLTPVLAAYLDVAIQQTPEIANLLRLSGSYLVRVCEAEFRLFRKLFGRDPSDGLFVFKGADADLSDHETEDDQETAFERLIFQLSGVLYSVIRPQLLVQKELEVLCEIVQVLQSEIIESVITPRAAAVGFVEPVMHRMIQDAQERLILCVQKYIRDEIEGFVPTAEDLDYPNKLIAAANSTSISMYATWYPALEHTLLCLSKVYHFVNMEIFEELAQDAIQVCTASLRMAAADLTAAKGAVHGSLFLVKHLLTLREQITPFDIKFAVRAKSLDFTSSADAMSHLLSDVTAIFSLSLRDNALVGLVANSLPQIQETTSDVKRDLEHELKRSCTTFIDAVLQQTAQPLLTLMKRIAELSKSGGAVDLRQHAFAKPDAVRQVLESVSRQINDTLPGVREAIHLYLRNASTETILFKPIERNLLDTVENLRVLIEQSFGAEERQSCDAALQLVLQQLEAL
ncbi:hypothetical protein PINS_up006955 [Pythium insidiosum]|nr:hypothetical protein PINS_up006955 [Pythium insidiosum]